jgi:hypothetical protein
MRLAPDDDIIITIHTAVSAVDGQLTYASRNSCIPGRAHSIAGSDPSKSGLVSTRAEVSLGHEGIRTVVEIKD